MEWFNIEDEPKLAGYKWVDFGSHLIIEGNDKVYTIKQLSPSSLSCECKGFQYRGRCKHVDYLQKRVKLTRVPRDWAEVYVNTIKLCFVDSKFSVYVAGSYLRGCVLVKDLDFVVVVPAEWEFVAPVAGAVAGAVSLFCKMLPAAFGSTIDPKSGRIVRGKLDAMSIDFYLCHPGEFGAMMMFLTGPKEFNIFCRTLARRKGHRLNQYGLFKLCDHGDRIVSEGLTEEPLCDCTTEKSIFAALGLDFMRPEQRQKFSTK